jgi:hypothetical protein
MTGAGGWKGDSSWYCEAPHFARSLLGSLLQEHTWTESREQGSASIVKHHTTARCSVLPVLVQFLFVVLSKLALSNPDNLTLSSEKGDRLHLRRPKLKITHYPLIYIMNLYQKDVQYTDYLTKIIIFIYINKF